MMCTQHFEMHANGSVQLQGGSLSEDAVKDATLEATRMADPGWVGGTQPEQRGASLHDSVLHESLSIHGHCTPDASSAFESGM